MAIRIVDVTDTETFGLVPPCADPGFDHRTCDYWEDADRGSKASRAAWLETAPVTPPKTSPSALANPFAPDDDEVINPFGARPRRSTRSRATTTRSPTTRSPRRARPGRQSAPMRRAS